MLCTIYVRSAEPLRADDEMAMQPMLFVVDVHVIRKEIRILYTSIVMRRIK